MKLSPEAEEVATFFAKMLEHEYTTKDIFRKNFFKDWRKVGRARKEMVNLKKNPNISGTVFLSTVKFFGCRKCRQRKSQR